RRGVPFDVEIFTLPDRLRIDREMIPNQPLRTVFTRPQADRERFAEDRFAVAVAGGVFDVEEHETTTKNSRRQTASGESLTRTVLSHHFRRAVALRLKNIIH